MGENKSPGKYGLSIIFFKKNWLLHGNYKQYFPFQSLREKCPNTDFFLVRIFPHSDWIWRDTKYLSVFSPNAGKYGVEKTPYLDTFHALNDCKKYPNDTGVVKWKLIKFFWIDYKIITQQTFVGLEDVFNTSSA